ncbi:hypothetical protein TWF281_002074 [Arthrobotrys megalospora]
MLWLATGSLCDLSSSIQVNQVSDPLEYHGYHNNILFYLFDLCYLNLPTVTAKMAFSSSSSSSHSLSYLPDYDPPDRPLSKSVVRVPRYQGIKRPRPLYDVAMGSSSPVDPTPEIIDLTTPPPPPSLRPAKRQRRAAPSTSSTSSSSSSTPAPPSPPKTVEVIDLTAVETVPSCSTWSQSSWSSGSASSSSMSATTTSTPPKCLFPPWGPWTLGENWESLGPLDAFPPDPLTLFYRAPTLYPFPEGPSSDIIASNPEVAFLFHVKAVGAERFFAKPVSSSDSLHMLPSSLTTTFWISVKMDTGNLNRLQRDMTLARKIGFLPFRSQEIAVNAIRNYTRLNRLCSNPEQLDGAEEEGEGDKEDDEEEEEEPREDKDGNPLSLEADWYPGTTHYKQIAEEWKDSHPTVRGLKGTPGFASPHQWKTRKQKSLRKHDWGKWEDEILKQRRGRIVA